MKKLLRAAVVVALVAALGATAAQAGRSSQKGVVNITLATYVWQPTTVAAMNDIVASFEQDALLDPRLDRPGRRQLRARQAADVVRRRDRGRHRPRRGGRHPELHPVRLPGQPELADPEQPQVLDPALALEHGQLRSQVRRSPGCRS